MGEACTKQEGVSTGDIQSCCSRLTQTVLVCCAEVAPCKAQKGQVWCQPITPRQRTPACPSEVREPGAWLHADMPSSSKKHDLHQSFSGSLEPCPARCEGCGFRPVFKYSLMDTGFQPPNSSGTWLVLRTSSTQVSFSGMTRISVYSRAFAFDHL